MKKSLYITILVSILAFTTVQAQTPYISLYSGYAVGVNKTSFLFNSSTVNNYDADSEIVKYSSQDYSLGQGLNLGGAIGYMVNENLGFEIGVNYTKSKSFEGLGIADVVSTDDNYREYYESVAAVQATMTRITPTIIYQFKRDRISPYAKLGLAIGTGTITTSETDRVEYTFGQITQKYTDTYEEKYTGGVSFGINSTVGVKLPLSKTISVFGEASLTNLSFAPNESEVTEATYEGEDYLNDLSTYEKNTLYKDEYTSSEDVDENTPSTALKQPYAFSNLAFNIGVTFSLGK
ncbi:MAG: hypothetical protein ACI96L_000557 [Paracoccaceae bacterium]|jgi:hypothetical protein